MKIHRGMLLRDAVAVAQQLGVKVEYGGRGNAGELIFSHQDFPHGRTIRVNCRRKDVARALVSALRGLARKVDPLGLRF